MDVKLHNGDKLNHTTVKRLCSAVASIISLKSPSDKNEASNVARMSLYTILQNILCETDKVTIGKAPNSSHRFEFTEKALLHVQVRRTLAHLALAEAGVISNFSWEETGPATEGREASRTFCFSVSKEMSSILENSISVNKSTFEILFCDPTKSKLLLKNEIMLDSPRALTMYR